MSPTITDEQRQALQQNPGQPVRLKDEKTDQAHLRPNLRRFVVGSYLVFYQPTRGGIRVVRILHGARRWEDES